jgi:hypothetical protein
MDCNHMQLEIDATATNGPVLFQSGLVGLMVFFRSIGLDLKTLPPPSGSGSSGPPRQIPLTHPPTNHPLPQILRLRPLTTWTVPNPPLTPKMGRANGQQGKPANENSSAHLKFTSTLKNFQMYLKCSPFVLADNAALILPTLDDTKAASYAKEVGELV